MITKNENKYCNEKGFTLVEISVTLVVIALLIAGVMVGRDLIKSAETRALISQMKKYEIAWHTFKLKYDCLAGDCKDAANLFTGAVGGNGDGVVNMWWAWGNVESLQTWNQWSHAGLVDGKYSSIPANIYIIINETNPATIINPKIGFTLHSTIGTVKNNFSYSLQIGALGLTNPLWHDFFWGAGFNATQAYDIDRKIDNGIPLTGKFRSTNASEPSDINPNQTCLSGSNYKLDTLNTGCSMYYKIVQ